MATGLYVQLSYKPRLGGGEEHAHQLVRHLNQLGERMVVLTLGAGTREEAEFDATCDYTVIRFRVPESFGCGQALDFLIRKPVLFREVFASVWRVKPDYVVASLHTSLVPLTALYAATKVANIPLLGFLHHISPLMYGHNSKLRWSIPARIYDMTLCVSNDTAQTVMKLGAAPHKIHTVYNGIDIHEIDMWRHVSQGVAPFSSHIDEIPPDAPVLLTVSRLVEYKGIQRVIEAMPRILHEIPNTRYVVVGDGGYRDELSRLAQESPARDAIVFLGSVTDAQKFACYDRCAVFVMPSEEEGFGIVFLEANAFGKPVIGGDVMGVPEAIVNGETGLLVDPYDVDAIADAVIRLLRDPGEARRLGENGRRRVEREFTWRASAERFLTLTRRAVPRIG